MTLAQRPAARPLMVHPPTWRAMRAEAFAVASRPIEDASARPKSAITDTYERQWGLDGKQLGSTAVIPVHGPIHGDETYVNAVMAFLFGGVGHGEIHEALKAALDDESIDSIILDIDSPGGEALGTPELAAAIRAANAIKPVTAYISGMGCSAAYYLASAAGRIVVDASALVGSIGTVFCFLDDTEALRKAGLEEIEIVSSQSPHKRLDPKTPQGRASYQKLADDLAAIFIADVARYRGVPEAKVMTDFGAGDVMVGTEAVKVGMADAVGSQQSVLADIRNSRGVPRSGKPKAAQGATALQSSKERPTMNLLQFLTGLGKADPAKLAQAAAILDGADEGAETPPATPAASAPAPAPAPADVAEHPDVKALREENARLRKQVDDDQRSKADGRLAGITTEAKAAVKEAVRKGHLLPASFNPMVALREAAVRADLGLPLPEGFTFVGAIDALTESLPTQELGRTVPAKELAESARGNAEDQLGQEVDILPATENRPQGEFKSPEEVRAHIEEHYGIRLQG